METIQTELVVIGTGPGGYTAGFRASDLGKKVVFVERNEAIGGVCLNVGCIPSKALLHAAKVIEEAEDMAQHGIHFEKPKVDNKKLLEWKNGTINQLTNGLRGLSKQRKIQIVQGVAEFTGSHELIVNGTEKVMNRLNCHLFQKIHALLIQQAL
jgi:dihydrolipoamide dehydrogenase